MASHVLAAVFFEHYVRYFGSLHPAFEMSCDTEYLEKKQLLIFSETWSSSFWIVCNFFDDFRTNFPQNNGRTHRKENIKFPKWRWIRSKKVCLSSALLFSLVLTENYVLRTSWGLSIWNNTCFLFKCRVTFRLGQFSKARFGTLALYILRLRCLWYRILIKTALFFEEIRNFPKRPWVRSKIFLSSGGLVGLVVIKKAVLRTSADLSTWNNTCFLFKYRVTFWLRYFSNPIFGTLALYLLRLRCLAIPNTWKKTTFDFFGNVVFVVSDCVQLFWWFSYKPSEK